MDNIKNEPSIRSVDFDGRVYYVVADVERFLSQKLSIPFIMLPMVVENDKRENVECATLEDIDTGIENESLSDFNEKLKRAANFNPRVEKEK